MNANGLSELGGAIRAYETAQAALANALKRAASFVLNEHEKEMPKNMKLFRTPRRRYYGPHLKVGSFRSDKVINGRKVCTHCKSARTASKFYYRPQAATKLSSWCKACTREAAQA